MNPIIRKLILEELSDNKIPILVPLDINKCKENYDESIFGSFENNFIDKAFDLKLSRSLSLNNEIIGGYMLKKLSMIENIKYIYHFYKSGEYTDLKLFVNKEFLNKYKNKIGIFSDFIYIDKEYQGNNYGKILTDYSKTLGNYVPEETESYWITKQKRIKVLQYKDDVGLVTLSVTPL